MQELIKHYNNRIAELKKKVSGMLDERNKIELVLKRMNSDIEKSIGAVEELELQKTIVESQIEGEKK